MLSHMNRVSIINLVDILLQLMVLVKQLVQYEFYGCHFHGCSKCFKNNTSALNKTLEREAILKQNGYNIVSVWECSFIESKEGMELEARDKLEVKAKERKSCTFWRADRRVQIIC